MSGSWTVLPVFWVPPPPDVVFPPVVPVGVFPVPVLAPGFDVPPGELLEPPLDCGFDPPLVPAAHPVLFCIDPVSSPRVDRG